MQWLLSCHQTSNVIVIQHSDSNCDSSILHHCTRHQMPALCHAFLSDLLIGILSQTIHVIVFTSSFRYKSVQQDGWWKHCGGSHKRIKMIINITRVRLISGFIWRNILCPARAPEHPRHEARPVTVNCPICKIYRSKSYQAKTNKRVILYKWSAPKYFKFLLAKAIFKIQICQIWQVVYSLNSSFVHFDGMKMKLLHDRVDHIIAFFHRNSWQATLLTGLFKHEMEFRRLFNIIN